MTTKEHLTEHDREIAAIRILIKTGMQMIVATREDFREARKEMQELRAAQKRTDASLKALIDQLRRSGGNGHAGKIDLQ
jgi:hypothetical protein